MEYFEQDMRNIFREGRRALEGIFHHLIMAYKQGDEWSILPGKDIQACKKVYIEVAEKIGLNVENHSLNLSKDNAKNAIKKGKSQGLWSLIIACLLVAHQNDRHPMHLAAKKNPNLLTDIKELSAQGNDASHYNAKTEAEPNVIRGYVEKIYAVAALFFVQEHSAAHTGENHG
ncbi:MAG: hypothetical protein GY862_12195 [Gammaproteobacteria bacterium]|nr:hypothetical protein [Gammaproteobacteria bacterium]